MDLFNPFQNFFLDRPLFIVQIFAVANDPVQGLEQFDIGSLGEQNVRIFRFVPLV